MVDEGGALGIVGRYQEKLDQERGIPIWVRVGLDGGLLLIGYINPQEDVPTHVQMARFFQEVSETIVELANEQQI